MDKIQLETNNYINLKIHDQKKPLVLVAPGGGYRFTSPREAEPIAEVFRNAGYNTGIIYYRETKLLYPDTVKELAEFLSFIRKNHEIQTIYLVGFSAGGHYVASLGVEWEKFGSSSKPDALILAYPVITGEKDFSHEGSIENLFGEINKEVRNVFSLEKWVSKKTPPTFLFHTTTDTAVPYQNSLFFFVALQKARVKAELHLYQEGPHGLALANRKTPFEDLDPLVFEEKYGRLSGWIEMALTWLAYIKK